MTEIPLFKVFMPETVMEPLKKVLMSGYIGQGPKVKEFENQLVPWVDNRNVLTLNCGTSALQLALRLSNVGLGDEVITTAITCTATNMPILAMGAKIVWADIDPQTGNIDPESIEKKITNKTKAILMVHWGGTPCDIEEINAIGNKYGLKVIEDACHAFGADYKGKKIGSHSDFVCFSFQAIKLMTTVDGGLLTCLSKEDFERGRLLRWYGIDRNTNKKDFRCEEDIVEWGYKFHMNDIAATIGIEQLKYVGENLRKVRKNAARYDEAFADLENIQIARNDSDRNSAFWLYTIRVKNLREFMKAMEEAKIKVSQVHARNDKHTCFAEYKTDLPGVNEFTSEHICLPVGCWLTDEQINHIIYSVTRYDNVLSAGLL